MPPGTGPLKRQIKPPEEQSFAYWMGQVDTLLRSLYTAVDDLKTQGVNNSTERKEWQQRIEENLENWKDELDARITRVEKAVVSLEAVHIAEDKAEKELRDQEKSLKDEAEKKKVYPSWFVTLIGVLAAIITWLFTNVLPEFFKHLGGAVK